MDPFADIHPTPAAWLRHSDLAAAFPVFWRYLLERHYAAQTRKVYVYGVAHFARWLTRRRRETRDLTEADVERFLDDHLPQSCASATVATRDCRGAPAPLGVLARCRDAGTPCGVQ